MNQAEISRSMLETLVEKAKAGDTESFGQVYDHCFEPVYRYVYHKVDSQYVDDIVGNIFMKAWEHLSRYHKRAGFTSWLFRIARNTVIDHYRVNRESVELHENIEDNCLLHQPEAVAERKLIGQLVRESLDRLEPKYQDVLSLKFLSELDNSDVARILGTTEANVRTMQFRALRKLREIIESSTEHHDKKAHLILAREAFSSS